jgi:hypothetical protein
MSGDVCNGHAAALVLRLLDGEEGAAKALRVAASSPDPEMSRAVMAALIAYAESGERDWKALLDRTARTGFQLGWLHMQRDRWFGKVPGGVVDEAAMTEKARAQLGPALVYRDYHPPRQAEAPAESVQAEAVAAHA